MDAQLCFFYCSAGKITFSVAKIQIKFAVFLIIRYLCGQNLRVFCASAHRPGMKTDADIRHFFYSTVSLPPHLIFGNTP